MESEGGRYEYDRPNAGVERARVRKRVPRLVQYDRARVVDVVCLEEGYVVWLLSGMEATMRCGNAWRTGSFDISCRRAAQSPCELL